MVHKPLEFKQRVTVVLAILVAYVAFMGVGSFWQQLKCINGCGKELATQLWQLADANTAFIDMYGKTPLQAVMPSTENKRIAAVALGTEGQHILAPQFKDSFQPLLPHFGYAGGYLTLPNRPESKIILYPAKYINKSVIVAQIKNVPRTIVEKAELDVDGIVNAEQGRLMYKGLGRLVTVSFVANYLD